MSVTLAQRRKFLTLLEDEFGRQLQARDWWESELWRPLDGFRGWPPAATSTLCDSCKARAGVVYDSEAIAAVVAHRGCAGLESHKVIISVANVGRQSGKTTGAGVYALSEMALARNSNVLLLASSEGQADRIFRTKLVEPIRRSPKLASRLVVGENTIRNPRRRNQLSFIPSSAKAVPGGSYRLIIVDEARDVLPEVAAALFPSILASKGLECPHGHYTCGMGPRSPAACPVCKTPLAPWWGRLLILSSAGDVTGWFPEMIEHLEEHPRADTHLFRSSDPTLNPSASEEARDALASTFGQLHSMKGLMARELNNEFGGAGDEFLPAAAIKAVTDETLTNASSSVEKCVGFIDCSRTTDLTSLIIAADASAHDAPAFSRLSVRRIDVWDPKKMGGRVNYQAIREHLDVTIPRFPGMLELQVDVALLADAEELCRWGSARPWGRNCVRPYRGDALTTRLLWDALSNRILDGTIEIPSHKRLLEELAAARVRMSEAGYAKVVDSARGDRRGRLHRDVAFSLAGVCWLAAKFMLQPARQGMDSVAALDERIGRWAAPSVMYDLVKDGGKF